MASPDARALAEATGSVAAPDELRSLAERRATLVREALLAADVSAERVTLREGPLAMGAGAPRVELVLGVEPPEVSASPPAAEVGPDGSPS